MTDEIKEENSTKVEVEVHTNPEPEIKEGGENIETEIKEAIEENKIDELISDIKQEAIEALNIADTARYAAEDMIERNKIEAQEKVTKYIEEHEEWKVQINQSLMNLQQMLEDLTSSIPNQPPVAQIPMEPQNENVDDQQVLEVPPEEQKPEEKPVAKIKAKIRAI